VRVQVPGFAPFFPLDEPVPSASSNSSSSTGYSGSAVAATLAAGVRGGGEGAAASSSGRMDTEGGPDMTLGKVAHYDESIFEKDV
jgi:hypothetical protein